MKVSTQTRYAMRMLLELALNEKPYERLTTQQIATNQGISEKYLEAIANKLKKAGYLDSSKGIGGGYLLRVAPESITVGDLMRLMETSFFQIHCVKDADSVCPQYDKCVMVEIWEILEKAIRDVVDNITIAYMRDRFIEKNRKSGGVHTLDEELDGIGDIDLAIKNSMCEHAEIEAIEEVDNAANIISFARRA